jgi:hypothetical protein
VLAATAELDVADRPEADFSKCAGFPIYAPYCSLGSQMEMT